MASEICSKANCSKPAVEYEGEVGKRTHGTYCADHKNSVKNEIDRFGDALDTAGN